MGLKAYIPEVTVINETKHRILFKSNNESINNEVIKVIEYEKFDELTFQSKSVFNLGFGDFDIERDILIDTILTGNDDQYLVFNTVLNSVPKFFESNPDDVIFVTGSDSSDEFIKACMENCQKKHRCVNICKKQHQRIRTYCGYISRHLVDLTKKYNFYGGNIDGNGEISGVSDFEKYEQYDFIFVSSKFI